MASSGIIVDEELKSDYDKMKKQKIYELLVMKLSDDKKKVIKDEVLCQETCDHEGLLEFFGHADRKKSCCYAVFEHKKTNKLVLIKWAPDDAPATKKMVYASTWATLSHTLEGAKKVEATDLDDLSESDLNKAK